MIKTLVLVRHGKAQPVSAARSDFDRELTPAGERVLREAFPETFALLGDVPDVHVWSSPATRALMTAEVVADAVGVDYEDIRLLDQVYEQDLESTLRAVMAAEEEVVVLVGHIPLVEDLAARLGADLSFDTGAAACFSMPAASGIPRLRWFVQGPTV